MKKLVLIIVFFLFASSNSQAIPIGGILKYFKGIFKEADQAIDAGGKAIRQSDNVNQNMTMEGMTKVTAENVNISNINKFSSKIDLQTLHKSNSNELGKFHRIDNLSDIFEFDDFTNDDVFSDFVLIRWVGYVLRTANYYRRDYNNKKNAEKRIVLQCIHSDNIFTITIDTIDNKTKIGYLSYHVNKNNNISFTRQRLHVLGDTKDYLLLSIKKEANKNFPTNYFIIYSDQRFEALFYPQGTETPAMVKTRIKKNSVKYHDNKCYRNFLDKGTLAKIEME